MVYAAECAWSAGATSVPDYERRYARWWHGVDDATGGATDAALANPFHARDRGAGSPTRGWPVAWLGRRRRTSAGAGAAGCPA